MAGFIEAKRENTSRDMEKHEPRQEGKSECRKSRGKKHFGYSGIIIYVFVDNLWYHVGKIYKFIIRSFLGIT